jgi:hypothetical protein
VAVVDHTSNSKMTVTRPATAPGAVQRSRDGVRWSGGWVESDLVAEGELLVDAWRLVVPKRVAREHGEPGA